MDSNCNKISENYTKNSYDLLPNDEKFESILQPILAMIQHKLKGNYLYAEEYLIKFLQQQRTKVETEDILDLSKHMSVCVAHLHIILVSMILSFILGFPLAFCLNTCYKKISNPNKYKYRLFTQAVLFTGAMGFLLIGSATSWDIGMKAQRYMDRVPKEYSNVIQTLNQTKFQFDANCKKLHAAVDSNLMKVTNLTYNIYDDIARIIDAKTSTTYLLSLKKFNNSINYMEEMFDSIGFVSVEDEPTSRLVDAVDQLHYETERISQYFPEAFLHMNDSAILAMERMMPDIVFPRNYVYPDWEEFYYDISITLNVLFPNMNSTIRFVDIIKRNLKDIHDKNLENVKEHIQQIQDFISSKCAPISEAIGLLCPERIEDTISRISLKLRQLTSYSIFSRNYTTGFVKLRTCICLFPSIYGFVACLFFIIGFIGACKGIYRTRSGKITTGTYPIVFFKVAIRISITFLWLILLITGVLYFIHIPTVVICGSIKKDKLTDRYLDRPYWKNETWIMSKLNKYVPQSKTSITVKSLLKKCRRNETIFRSLNLEEHINNYYGFSLNEIVQESKEEYAAVIRRQTSTSFNYIMHYINLIDYRLDMNFISEVQNDLSRTQHGIDLLKQRILNMNSTQTFLFDTGVADIQRLMAEMKMFLEDFVKAKLLVQVVKNELLTLEMINDRLHNITKNELYVDVYIYLNNITNHIICLQEKTETFIKHSLLYEFGNCNFLPYIYDKLKWFVCDYGLELMNSLWLSLAIIGFSIIIATILACRIACYVRGTYKIHGRYLPNHQRYSDKQSAIINRMGPTSGYRK